MKILGKFINKEVVIHVESLTAKNQAKISGFMTSTRSKKTMDLVKKEIVSKNTLLNFSSNNPIKGLVIDGDVSFIKHIHH